MKPSDLSKHISPWFDSSGPGADIVISSRVRLARNLAGFEFSSRLTDQKKTDILKKITDTIENADIGEKTFFVNMEKAPSLDQDLLVERHLVSHQHIHAKGPRGAVIAENESFTAMINEEDHLRIQVFKTGLQLKQCWEKVNHIDDLIEKNIEYAFTPQYGYLTACPTNLGTGIRVSVMLHLPALKITGHIEKFLNAARDTNLAVRGLFGEGTDAVGDFYQLSNQVTLGISEIQIIEEFTYTIVPKIAEYESLAREELLKTQTHVIDDKIQRALAILKSARLISSQEALFLLSQIRLGVNLDRIKDISIATVNELFMLTQPAHLQINNAGPLDPDARDTLRAQIIRSKLCQN